MKRMIVILLVSIGLMLMVTSCSEDKPTEPTGKPSLETETREGTLSLPENATIDFNDIEVVSFSESASIDEDGSYSLLAPRAEKYQIIMFNSKNTGNPIFLGLHNPLTRSMEANVTSTALALTLINPMLIYSEQHHRMEYLDAIQEHSQFPELISKLITAYQSDAELALDYDTNTGIYELVGKIAIETIESLGTRDYHRNWGWGSSAPSIENSEGDNIKFVNDSFSWYAASIYPVGGNLKEIVNLDRKSKAISFRWSIPPVVRSEPLETEHSLGDGEFEIFISKGFDPNNFTIMLNDPRGRATALNMAQAILYMIELKIGVLPNVNVLDLPNHINVSSVRANRFSQFIQEGDSYGFIINLCGLIEENKVGIAYWIWGELVSEPVQNFIGIAATLSGKTGLVYKAFSATNEQSLFFLDQVFADQDITYHIIQTNGRITHYDTNRVLTPSFNPPPGRYSVPQTVTISCNTPDATIRYTTDGSDPNQSSPIYSNPIQVSTTTTLIARAYKQGYEPSFFGVAIYNIDSPETVSTPTFEPPGGNYNSAQNVTINCATAGATIRYTTNGSEPTENSDVYTTAIEVTETTTIKARAYKEGWDASQIATAEYSIGEVTPGEMVLVQGGSFSPDGGNYNVTLSSFYIGKYEVTQSEWTEVMGGIYDPDWSDYGQSSNHPAYRISWFDAIEYCNRLSIREGLTPAYSYSTYGTNPSNWPSGWKTSSANHTNVTCNWNADGYRLPTEMEWEFAARGGVPAQNAGTFNDSWAGTNVEAQLVNYAWYYANSNSRTQPVGTKLPNELGLYDMSGNVWEWNWDIYGSYPTGSYNDPKGASSGSYRVLRGGSWYNIAFYCRVVARSNIDATYRSINFGFRVSRTLN